MDELLKFRIRCLYTKVFCRKSMASLSYIDYLRCYHKILNLKKPDTVGAKIQWIKKYGHLERYTDLVDKYKVRDYIGKTIGSDYLSKIYYVFNNSDEIELENLPNKFVLKCNHCSGGIYICKDKSKITQKEWKNVKKNLKKWLSINYYNGTGETQYRYIEKKIICEEYLEDDSGSLRDYEFYCFNGKPKYIAVSENTHTSKFTIDYFDLEWNKDNEFNCVGDKNNLKIIRKPINLDEMLNIVKKLSEPFEYIRVDLRLVKSKVYFGELTFTSANGTWPFKNQEKEIEIGKLIDLENYI